MDMPRMPPLPSILPKISWIDWANAQLYSIPSSTP
jgi:hypothetical protein